MANGKNGKMTGTARFRPDVKEKRGIRATRFFGLCKSCGECIVKCPVKCISWDKTEMGQLGEQGIFIDMDVCIGCKTCEFICPDHAIQITVDRANYQAPSPKAK